MQRSLPLLATAVIAACAPDYEADAFDRPRDAWPYFYPQLVEARAPHARPISDQDLADAFDDAFAADDPVAQGLDAASLRAGILDALNIGFELDGFAARPYTITPQFSDDSGPRRSRSSTST